MTARRVAATVTAAVFSVVTGFVGATSAFAQVPPPDTGSGTSNVPAAPVTTSPGTSHTLLYVLVAVAAVAVLALSITAARFYGRRGWRSATPKVTPKVA
jgi:hypothetical protein